MASIEHDVEQLSGLISVGPYKKAGNLFERLENFRGSRDFKFVHREEVVETKELEENALPVRTFERRGKSCACLT
ncbi:MAG TPA: hypothetical protein VNF75_00705 [Candidatus Dormibacteraeota bacterium]|nr:hypothetical protein [Candidatus Dormibacteraeota bacterium]